MNKDIKQNTFRICFSVISNTLHNFVLERTNKTGGKKSIVKLASFIFIIRQLCNRIGTEGKDKTAHKNTLYSSFSTVCTFIAKRAKV